MDEKKKKPLTFKEKVLRLLLIGMLLFSVCGIAYFYMMAKASELLEALDGIGCPSDEPSKIEGVARFTLPPSATNLESFCMGMQGWGADARFEMSPDDLPIFIGSVWIKTELSSESQPRYITQEGYFSFDIPFEQMTSYLHSYETNGSDLVQEILIDTSSPERFTVYLLILAG